MRSATPAPEPTRVYELHTPEGFEAFDEAMHGNFSDPDLPEQEKHARFLAACEQHGLVHHLELAEEVRTRLGI